MVIRSSIVDRAMSRNTKPAFGIVSISFGVVASATRIEYRCEPVRVLTGMLENPITATIDLVELW